MALYLLHHLMALCPVSLDTLSNEYNRMESENVKIELITFQDVKYKLVEVLPICKIKRELF